MPGMAGYDWITFTSDYGLEDHFVGVCHGVMARVAPRARVLDVSHAVAAQDVRQGAVLLAQAVPYLPRAVHLAVVDPGVGTGRGMVAVEAGGQVLVGPDNGLLLWAAEALGGVGRAHALENPAFRLAPVSRTFHGRDVFAPAAAHLAAGVEPAELGPEMDPEGLVRLERPAVTAGRGRVAGSVVAVDRFGNLALDLGRRHPGRAPGPAMTGGVLGAAAGVVPRWIGGVRGTAGVVPRWTGGVGGTAGVVPRWIGGVGGTAGVVPRSVGRWVPGFGRCATDAAGRWGIRTVKPGPLPAPEGATEAPHLDVSVFARGLLGRLVTRIYFPDEAEANAADPVLGSIPEPRLRARLVAVAEGDGLRFDIWLQGERETPFLAI